MFKDLFAMDSALAIVMKNAAIANGFWTRDRSDILLKACRRRILKDKADSPATAGHSLCFLVAGRFMAWRRGP
jgi:hypothetical protein